MTDLGLLTIHAMVGMMTMLMPMEKKMLMIVIKKKGWQGWSLGGGFHVKTTIMLMFMVMMTLTFIMFSREKFFVFT